MTNIHVKTFDLLIEELSKRSDKESVDLAVKLRLIRTAGIIENKDSEFRAELKGMLRAAALISGGLILGEVIKRLI